MIGHQQIIEARKRRLRPAAIFFDFGSELPPVRFPFEHPEKALYHRFYPTVTVPPSDDWRLLDLRFVTGCRVHLTGKAWTEDFFGFGERLVDCGASALVACCPGDNNDLVQWTNGQWSADAPD
jgi:hypothetical protein